MSSSMGTLFRVTTFGESHGVGVGAVVDGCPARVELREDDIQPQLDRRRPGQSGISTPREEKDTVQILSGVEEGVTLGTPIAMLVRNRDQRPGDYKEMREIPRPSHADYTYQKKYGIRASSGGGRSSARETIGRVAAGAVAEKLLRVSFGCEIVAWVSSVGGISLGREAGRRYARSDVDANPIRCPEPGVADEMIEAVERARDRGDSLGGVVSCECRGVATGWGEPVFDKLEAVLGKAMLSIPAVKGFEIGSGFAGTELHGSEHNDRFVCKESGLGTATNNSGGVQGGISNGEPIHFRVAFKPPATIALPQETADFSGREVTLEARGRHDPCVVPRAVPIVETMTAMVLVDAALQQKT